MRLAAPVVARTAEDPPQPVARPLHAFGHAAHLRVDIDEIDPLLDAARDRDRLVAARLRDGGDGGEQRRGAEDQTKPFHTVAPLPGALPLWRLG